MVFKIFLYLLQIPTLTITSQHHIHNHPQIHQQDVIWCLGKRKLVMFLLVIVSQRGCMPVILFGCPNLWHMGHKKREQGGNPSPARPQ